MSTSLPYQDYRRLGLPKPAKLHSGLDGVVHHWIGRYRRALPSYRRLHQVAREIHASAENLRDLDRQGLAERLAQHIECFRLRPKEEDLHAALATLVEAADRILGQRPRVVQIMGALGLDKGFFVEMATGEGKSLTAALSATLAAWHGRPCHVLTVNDYLARRDAEACAPFYDLCGVTVGAATADMSEDDRRSVYQEALVYTTAKQLLADFLRDRLRLGSVADPARRLIRGLMGTEVAQQKLLLRGLDTAIIDEADSVLIDEAVSPLIIAESRANPDMIAAIKQALVLSRHFIKGVHYHCEVRYREVHLTREGEAQLAGLAVDLPGIWHAVNRREELLLQALRAREFFQRDLHYVVKDSQVVIVDEFTGRLAQQRSWSQGLHQAIEAKEGVAITNPNETLLRLSFQRFFRLFRRLSGMSGTAREAADELWRIYRLPVLAVPEHRSCQRLRCADKIVADASSKWQAIAQEARDVRAAGRAVLIGTRSVRDSERLAACLDHLGLVYELLNAVHHEREAEIVTRAGRAGAITIATNMAGRGTDIQLVPQLAASGGLHVIVSECHESGRIDRQLIGRCARQGDPGTARVYISPDDELLRRFYGPLIRRVLKVPGFGFIGVTWLIAKLTYRAQITAERLAYRQRREVLRTDTWLEESLTFGDPGKGGYF